MALEQTIELFGCRPTRWANSLGRHPSHICAVFRAETGTTVRGYLTQIRLERAAYLIARGEKIEAVALDVGYKSKNQFYRQFKRHYGMTPATYCRRSPQE